MFARKDNTEIEYREVPCDGKPLSRYYGKWHDNGDLSIHLSGSTREDASREIYELINKGWTVTKE